MEALFDSAIGWLSLHQPTLSPGMLTQHLLDLVVDCFRLVQDLHLPPGARTAKAMCIRQEHLIKRKTRWHWPLHDLQVHSMEHEVDDLDGHDLYFGRDEEEIDEDEGLEQACLSM